MKTFLRCSGVGSRHVAGTHEELAQEDHGQNYAHDAQRVGHGAAQRRSVGVDAHLLQRLLRGAQRRVLVVAPHRMPDMSGIETPKA